MPYIGRIVDTIEYYISISLYEMFIDMRLRDIWTVSSSIKYCLAGYIDVGECHYTILINACVCVYTYLYITIYTGM